jgi:hypothetical protein
MHDIDISPSTPVRHKDGGAYSIVSITTVGDQRRAHINRAGFGTVFEGTVPQARTAGFTFGDEHMEPEVTVVSMEALLDPPQPSFAQMQEQVEQATAEIATLKAAAAERDITFTDLRRRATVAQRELEQFKEQVVEAVKGARKEHDLCIDGCNDFLGGLGLPKISKTWKVTVTRDCDYETVLVVSGVEANNESDARDIVSESFAVSATVNQITYTYEYDGEGEADWESEEYIDRDDEDDDTYASTHKDDGLSFTAEEE